ncbi:hypothetical protein CDAR_597201 [Caerostris darwini]|uniref:Secreted protein n=1 Tax=Caerostris darwini TaxID=1538125 RepID=A0AAV4U2E4_9ARAC|nr:hypothetical protein CDAR_597201 [Caerostris darwini]
MLLVVPGMALSHAASFQHFCVFLPFAFSKKITVLDKNLRRRRVYSLRFRFLFEQMINGKVAFSSPFGEFASPCATCLQCGGGMETEICFQTVAGLKGRWDLKFVFVQYRVV